MECERCGRVWDGNAQCSCPGNISEGTDMTDMDEKHSEFYQKLHRDLQHLREIDPHIEQKHLENVDALLCYLNMKLLPP
jgi:hypothetical protein